MLGRHDGDAFFSWQVLAGVALGVTLRYESDMVEFVLAMLGGAATSAWFGEYLRGSIETTAEAREMRRRLVAGEGRAGVLRLYTALFGLAGMHPTGDEVAACVRLATQGRADMQSALCFALACPGLADNEAHGALVAWLRERVSVGGDMAGSEMLLLVGIHFHAKQLALIADLVRATLGIHVQIHGERCRVPGPAVFVSCVLTSLLSPCSLRKMGDVIMSDVLTEDAVAAHAGACTLAVWCSVHQATNTHDVVSFAVAVAPTPSLSASIDRFLPLHCVFRLLKGMGRLPVPVCARG